MYENISNNKILNSYYREIKNNNLNIDEEINLFSEIRKGDKKAFELIIKKHLNLVVKVANKYNNKGLPLLDLISEGNIAMIKAIGQFNKEKEMRFSSFAYWKIKNAILKYFERNLRLVRLPANIINEISKNKKLHEEIKEEWNGFTISFDEPCGKKGNKNNKQYSLYDVIADDTITPFELEMTKTTIEEIFSYLKPIEVKILTLHYFENWNFEVIGGELNMCRERIRQIKNMAIQKIKDRIK